VHPADEITQLIQHYYCCSTIRGRMIEFLGGSTTGNATAVYAVANDGVSGFSPPAHPNALEEFLRQGYDVERSLWDRGCLVADLDIDYENFDCATELYSDPERVFGLIQPALRSAVDVLSRYGIIPMEAISGRGYHLV